MGLVQYDSSDEDEEVQSQTGCLQSPKLTSKPTSSSSQDAAPAASPSNPGEQAQPPQTSSGAPVSSVSDATPAPLGPVLGPALGPSRPPPRDEQQQTQGEGEEIDLSFLDDNPSHPNRSNPDSSASPPRSPYSRTRTLLRNLTLPSVPNMDIPPSPPGSPPPGLDALTAKFDTFLRLKRTKGVHFNERLAGSTGMANPAVADKLLAFVGIGTEFPGGGDDDVGGGRHDGGGGGREEGLTQYATTLSPDVWDGGVNFPAWAYKGALRRAQERVSKERERARGEPVEFVSAGSVTASTGVGEGTGSAGASRSGTPGVGTGSGKRKGRWDV
ncbi:hypothetical protein C7999DRAFT_14549 [Corynascus novoguineensis]|uniref:HCNGP-like protein n=1 Tax=Corynascus novoguineensis TaxID=1126955 RepID=A0AAN7CSY1_9PEZI|nr:hypothetical protein C7999DRAFT_14549 [Corynascus novoguineensis]